MEAAADTPQIPPLTLRRRLYLARDEAGLNQAEMADRIGISRRSVVNYERGTTHPSRPVLLSWALATGVPLEWLTSGNAESSGKWATWVLGQLELSFAS